MLTITKTAAHRLNTGSLIKVNDDSEGLHTEYYRVLQRPKVNNDKVEISLERINKPVKMAFSITENGGHQGKLGSHVQLIG